MMSQNHIPSQIPEKPMIVWQARSKRFSDEITYDEFDKVQHRQLLRKVDLRLVPILTFLYLLGFLDRTIIGNANIGGLSADLHISPSTYNTALALYFLARLIFEIPANIVLKRFDPQFWLPFLTLTWGIASIAQGFVTDQASLFVARILLGVTEAGLLPGVVFVFSIYYVRRERHWRVAIFCSGAAFAGAFGGILSYCVGKMDGIGGKNGWQWVFIFEGLLNFAVSAVAFAVVPTWPQNAQWLTEEERCCLLSRLDADCDDGEKEKFEWGYVFQAFLDPLIWGYALLFHGIAFVTFTLGIFLPVIIADMGFATSAAQLMTIPPNALAGVGIIFGAWLAAWTGRRAPVIIGFVVVAIIGYAILLAGKTTEAQYAGVHFAALGVYTSGSLLLSWPSENISGQTKRAVGIAMQITIGYFGAVTGVLVYQPEFPTQHFRKPHIIAICHLIFSIIVAGVLWHRMANENRRRAKMIADNKDKIVGRETKVLLGDREIHWKYRV